MDCTLCGTPCTCSVPSALTTAKAVDSLSVPKPVDARPRMHSDEPIEDRFVNHPSANADDAWRAEVASRVSSYRARRKRKSAVDDSPALDFGPAAGATHGSASQKIGWGSPVTSSRTPQGSVPRPPAQPGGHGIDTNYYRRLNAESKAQGLAIQMGATAAATAPAEAYDGFELQNEAINGPSSAAERDDTLRQERIVDLSAKDPASCEAALDTVLDLEIRPTVTTDSSLDRYCICDTAPEPMPEPEAPAAPVQGNLIVFPRALMEPPLLPQPSRDELAEPMNSRPRILEVPEDIMPIVQGSLFPEIRLDSDVEEGASIRQPEIDVPLQVAPVSTRLIAGLTDCGVVIAAGLLFAAMTCRALPGIPHTKPFWMTLGATTLLLWAVYQSLFLLYAGRTLGMSMRGIRLSTFEGRAPQWTQRCRRARFIFISFAAAAMGFLWALVDEDELCWHDRISRTFPTTE